MRSQFLHPLRRSLCKRPTGIGFILQHSRGERLQHLVGCIVDAATLIGEALHGLLVGPSLFGQLAEGGKGVCDSCVFRAVFCGFVTSYGMADRVTKLRLEAVQPQDTGEVSLFRSPIGKGFGAGGGHAGAGGYGLGIGIP